MKTYTIYCHKNKINGKMYFGQTCRVPEKRWNNGKGYIGCPAFYNAIKKYGWDSFEHIIMFTGLTKIQADYYERYLIRIYRAMDCRFGYNCNPGGQFDVDYSHSLIIKKYKSIDATVIKVIDEVYPKSNDFKLADIVDLLNNYNGVGVPTKRNGKWTLDTVKGFFEKFGGLKKFKIHRLRKLKK